VQSDGGTSRGQSLTTAVWPSMTIAQINLNIAMWTSDVDIADQPELHP
jgi:hypothetical protein